MLEATSVPLGEAHDLIALDLDGVVYVGRDAVPDAPEHLRRARGAGSRLAFVTNNAARPPSAVGDHLREIGIEVADDDVVTSAQAAARLLADRLAPGSRVYLIGGDGLDQALRERGLEPVTSPGDDPVAVVQGYGPDMPWRRVVAGAILVADGLPWVASNTDLTIPTATGIGPGNGALVRLVAQFAGREPEVAGKPSPPLLRETQQRVGGRRPLFVGDRLDTDIVGAHNVGWPSLLVRTGVSGLADLAAAPPDQRPTFLSADLGGLLTTHEAPVVDDGVALGGWRADPSQDAFEVLGDGSADDWWRVAATACWLRLDRTGEPYDVSAVVPPGAGTQVR